MHACFFVCDLFIIFFLFIFDLLLFFCAEKFCGKSIHMCGMRNKTAQAAFDGTSTASIKISLFRLLHSFIRNLLVCNREVAGHQ